MVLLGVGLAAASVGWFILDAFLASKSGLDLSDEGLYLIASDAAQRSTPWALPGWSTSWLFGLVGYDIAAFRTAGALILAIAGAILGAMAFRCIQSVDAQSDPSSLSTWITTSIVALGSAITSLAFYSTMLRSPSYNWAHLVGLILIGIGALQFINQRLPQLGNPEPLTGFQLVRQHLGGILVSGLGIVLAVPAKPTTGPLALAALFVMLLVWQGLRRAALFTFAVGISTGILITLAVLTRLWMPDFISVFLDAASRPPLVPSHSLAGATKEFLRIPVEIYIDIRGEQRSIVLLIGISFFVLFLSTLKRIHPIFQGLALVILMTLAVLHLQDDWSYWQQIWERGRTTTSVIIGVLGLSLFSIGIARWSGAPDLRARSLRFLSGTAFLIYLAFLYGFGSSLRPFVTAKFALVLLLAAAIVAVGPIPYQKVKAGFVIVLAGLGVLLTLYQVGTSRQLQYGFTPVADQTERVLIGTRGSELMVSPQRANLIRGVSEAVASGGGSDVKLLNIGPDTVSLAYASGAALPPTGQITWFAQPGIYDVAEYNLSRLDGVQWRDSWILLSERDPEADRVMAIIGSKVCRSFPADYEKVYEHDLVESDGTVRISADGRYSLWKPRVTGQTAVSDPCVS
jgi:hypothetical protein